MEIKPSVGWQNTSEPKESEIVESYRCSECKKVYVDKLIADKCCEIKYCNCGKKLRPHYLICSKCREKRNYEEANKIKYSKYEIEYLYDENSGEYFYDKENMMDYYADEELDPPSWAYGCYTRNFKINIDLLFENAIDQMHDEFSSEDIRYEKELREFVKKWNDKQTGITYFKDIKTVVLLGE